MGVISPFSRAVMASGMIGPPVVSQCANMVALNTAPSTNARIPILALPTDTLFISFASSLR
jgi:TPP-dependent trihydroxycyclohexane-1,2-dione (THcHDO) dehydratase